jgi:hypothetical protein
MPDNLPNVRCNAACGIVLDGGRAAASSQGG